MNFRIHASQSSARRGRRWLASLVLLLTITCSLCFDRSVLSFAGSVQAAEGLRVGTAQTDITPPSGFPMAGYYFERLAEGAIDPLQAKAIVFRNGDTAAAMVVCDLTGISRDLCQTVRQRVSAQTGIPAASIAVSATHSHTAPDYSKQLYRYLGEHPESVKPAPTASDRKERDAVKDATGDTEGARSAYDAAYIEKLVGGIVEAVVEADAKCKPAVVTAGSALQVEPVSFNRRFVMKDGSVQTWKSLADPLVVRAAGPVDPELDVVMFNSPEGDPLGSLSSFALHLDTVGGTRWSADYPFFIEQSLQKRFGKELVSVFGTGCCGDINHSDPSRSERNKTEAIGRALATTVDAAIANSDPLKKTDLVARSSVVHLPLQAVSQEQIDRAAATLQLIQDGSKIDFLEQVTAYKTMMIAQFRPETRKADTQRWISWGLSHAWADVGNSLPVDVQTICIGDQLALVFLPGEVFVELGLAIKQASPYEHTLVIELSNSIETAYIPTRAAAAGGSYEVTNSTVEPGAGEMLVEAALTLLRESASGR